MARQPLPAELRELADAFGLLTEYEDVEHRKQRPSAESLLAILRQFDPEIASAADAQAALERRKQARVARGVEPVIVAWDGVAPPLAVHLRANEAGARARLSVELQAGGVLRHDATLDHKPRTKSRTARQTDGAPAPATVTLPDKLPVGYHRLQLELGRRTLESLVISAPRRSYRPQTEPRAWGCFLPLYALRSDRNWGSGDFTDLEEFAGWVSSQGGEVVATLPLLPAFLDEPCDPSPYAPVSRLFWNEFYVDVSRIPDLANCPAALSLVESPDFCDQLEELRRTDRVDYRRLMSCKRRVLELLAKSAFTGDSARRKALAKFIEQSPRVVDYARFRATCNKRRAPWQNWPARLRDGKLTPKDYDAADEQFFLYAQWVATEQLTFASAKMASLGTGLYLDLPLGVRPDGYDMWRDRRVFAFEASAGAPPDSFFTKGQNWGLAPLIPDAIRNEGYAHVRAFLAHHLSLAAWLRIDHVMGLHRLYWIPAGMSADNGVYVQYPADELYAILCLESHRHQTLLVGENLGTVPPAVNKRMDAHRVSKMFVVQYELGADADFFAPEGAKNSVASLNTHDMPRCAAWWQALDLPDRQDLCLLNDAGLKTEMLQREKLTKKLRSRLYELGYLNKLGADLETVVRGLLEYLAESPAELLLIDLEDVWLETRTLNTPGTTHERYNWQTKSRYSIAQFSRLPEVRKLLKAVCQRRQPAPAAVHPGQRKDAQ